MWLFIQWFWQWYDNTIILFSPCRNNIGPNLKKKFSDSLITQVWKFKHFYKTNNRPRKTYWRMLSAARVEGRKYILRAHARSRVCHNNAYFRIYPQSHSPTNLTIANSGKKRSILKHKNLNILRAKRTFFGKKKHVS